MRKILRVGKDVKARRSRVRELMNLKISSLELDIKLNLAACGGTFSTGLTRLTRFSYFLYILNIPSILSKKWDFLYYPVNPRAHSFRAYAYRRNSNRRGKGTCRR